MIKKDIIPARKTSCSQSPSRGFSAIDVISLAFGSIIGWAWILFTGEWVHQAGVIGAMLAFLLGIVFCVFVGFAYAELTPAIPSGGGGVSFSITAMGPFAGLISGLGTSLAYLGVAAWRGPSLIMALSYLFPVPESGFLWTIQGEAVYLSTSLIAAFVGVILIAINIKGTRETAVFQSAVTIAIVFIGILFLLGSFFFGDLEYAAPKLTNPGGFMSVLLVVPSMFVGFDVIPQAAGEMDVPLKKIPFLLILSIFLGGLWYILMILAVSLSAPESVRIGGSLSVADVMSFVFGHPFFGRICILSALGGILTSWNGFLFGSARCIAAMSNRGLLPAFLGKSHPKYHTPSNAILLCGLICIFTSFLGSGALNWFVNSSSFGAVIMYATVVLSFIVLRKKAPDLHRPYVVQHGKLYGFLAGIVVLCFFCIFLPFSPGSLCTAEWIIVFIWFAAGILCYVFVSPKKSHSAK